jgi:hypothetical protein
MQLLAVATGGNACRSLIDGFANPVFGRTHAQLSRA